MAASLAMLSSTACLDLTHFDHASDRAVQEVLGRGGPTGKLDVAIAFGCPANDDGSLSECERCRVDSVVRAYREGVVGAAILTGGAAHGLYVEAQAMAQAVVDAGVPRERVFLEPGALTTWMNLRRSQRIMRSQGFRTALMISTSDHLPRVERFVAWYGIPARYRACDRGSAPTDQR